MLGILVVQDLAVVPLMIVLPELSNAGRGVRRVVARQPFARSCCSASSSSSRLASCRD